MFDRKIYFNTAAEVRNFNEFKGVDFRIQWQIELVDRNYIVVIRSQSWNKGIAVSIGLSGRLVVGEHMHIRIIRNANDGKTLIDAAAQEHVASKYCDAARGIQTGSNGALTLSSIDHVCSNVILE